MRTGGLLATSVIAFSLLATPAFAQTTPTDETYGSPVGNNVVAGETTPPTTEPTSSPTIAPATTPIAAKSSSSDNGASLPSTGLAIALVLGTGLLLLGLGLGMRRAIRPTD
jgi:hypothetical protein